MKLLSFVVPSYNSEKYLNKCVDSLLKGGEDVEIIIVNDGSKDNTIKIAREYEEKYRPASWTDPACAYTAGASHHGHLPGADGL